ncbi:MAG: aminotransferase class I/II-fold pyridoxal phosphate-dependent enzyme [Deltaproteobacteria bacterium]|nr:MAG: aminotransferase class I/II-fold pyridoxal phosphate-dependent enzyme [Deltaproteobacteria bacterium]
MPIDTSPWLADPKTLPERSASALARSMKGSTILAIAGEVLDLKARGVDVANFTIGDFAPSEFRVPPLFLEHLQRAQGEGQTFYPPAVGTPELRAAVRDYYRRVLGLSFPEGTIQVGSGARPLIYAAFACLVDPGDTVVYQVPSWNTEYYVDLNGAEGVALVARPEHSFMLTADDIAPHLQTARLLVINSPQNPSGTAISRAAMKAISDAIVTENRRREGTGERPLYLLYDMVYWQLTLQDVEHITPIHANPEMARYTVLVDAISKSWAATGVRVGWAACPPWVLAPMKALIGHMGAWAGRAPQIATARTLAEISPMEPWSKTFRAEVAKRQLALYNGFTSMNAEGLPVYPVKPEGALYVTARFALHGASFKGQKIETDEDIRHLLLHEAGTAIVPFVTFGYPDGTGWVRFSIGAVSGAEVEAALDRIAGLLRSL